MRHSIFICILYLFIVNSSTLYAQDEQPSVSPTMIIDTKDGPEEQESYSGSAPIDAHFHANPKSLGNYTPYYEWRFFTSGNEKNPFLKRFDEDVDYTFTNSGTSYIRLYVTFVLDTDTISVEPVQFMVNASSSKLEVPNAFSPNDDGQNDIFKVKSGYQSIISFKGAIFNRWGKKLFEWTDIDSGWDGKYNGTDVKDGVYYCVIKAKGADGIDYDIRTDVNLLRGYTSSSKTTE